ncbi:hypothetical protein FQB35_11705 [Crassaminicella thermophila]|uniref:Poly(3-hydroxyalkanoate) polymerase subunit PhaE n=1 Tax=Crassaminicella thermophila TaxID=2599308 RepID=A0A5C0SGR0_CRATE|nr:poly(R)-hydroxyalkanoic acid synthase subunit PhaE [Crassaminicella thermophila]QEK12936.1 hypothetical protein FQB35_11705 [Crassaminicella thermophila]
MFFLDAYNNFMGQWVDSQKKVIDMWQESFAPKDEKKDSAKVNNMEEAMKNQMEIFNQWVEMMSDMFTKNISLFGGGPTKEVLDKMMNSANIYSYLYRFWDELNKQATANPTDYVQKVFSKWQNEYIKTFSNHFVSYLPEPTQNIFKESMEIYQMYFDNVKKFSQPWLENAKEFQKLMGTNIYQDKDAFFNYVKLWGENYEKTFGKFFDTPIMGINREYFEKQMESIDSFMKYTNTLSEFSATIFSVGLETMEKIAQDLQNMMQNESHPKTFKEFYEYWWRKNEEAYKNLFQTDDFSSLLAQVVDASVVFKKNYDKLLEQQLAFLPFPTKTDMNSLYKTVYELKKSVRKTRKELNELEKRLKEKGE